eukprot:8214179-Alexandrium_andersonii.AAC.2
MSLEGVAGSACFGFRFGQTRAWPLVSGCEAFGGCVAPADSCSLRPPLVALGSDVGAVGLDSLCLS